MFALSKNGGLKNQASRSTSRIAALASGLAICAATCASAARLDNASYLDLTDSAEGTVTGSGSYLRDDPASYGHVNAFDNKADYDNSRVIFATATGWVAYTFREATVVDAFTLKVPTWNVATRSPKHFTLSGSNDGGATWTLLDEETGQTGWRAQEVRTYGFENETAFLSYKFEVLEDNGEGIAQFSELQLLRISERQMTDFVWQPTGVSSGRWTDETVWVGAVELSPSVYHYPTKEASVYFDGVQTPEVVVEIDGSRACSGLSFAGSKGLTNLVIRGTESGSQLWYYGTESWAWPSDSNQTVVFDNVTLESFVSWMTVDATGIFVLRNGAVVSGANRTQIGAVGTSFQMRLEGGSSASLSAFGLSCGSSVIIDDSTFQPRAMNLTWQGQTEPGSVRLRGNSPRLLLERLVVSAPAAVGDVVFEVPSDGYASAPIQQPSGTLQLDEPFSNGDGTVQIVVDNKSPVFYRRGQTGGGISVPLLYWKKGILTEHVSLARLPHGSSFRWGWGESGEETSSGHDGDLPTALWLDAVPLEQGSLIVVR